MTDKKRKQKAAREVRNKRKNEAAAEAMEPQIQELWKPYADNWSNGHASHFSNLGYYAWMAGFLKGFGRVLEIGTGDATGTIAIHQNGSTILSIDQNPFCHDIAERKLTEAGVSFNRERRGKVNARGNKFSMSYPKPESIMADSGVLLLEGDIGSDHDEELVKWARSLPKFDAVACWNIGTNRVINKTAGDIDLYRVQIQTAAYRLAHDVLRAGGILHIIDRIATPKPGTETEVIDDHLEGHRDMANHTSILVNAQSVEIKPFVRPSSGSGIGLRMGGNAGVPVGDTELAFFFTFVN